jgi:tetratricopeptide (TPR) repeat protein
MGQVRTSARASALNAAGAMLWASGEAAEARPLLSEALAIGREVGDEWDTGWALLHLGTIAYQQGDYGAAQPLLEVGLASCRAAGAEGRRGVGWALIFLGDLALHAGELEQARAHFAESIALLRELSDYGLLAYPLRRLGHLALHRETSRRRRRSVQRACGSIWRSKIGWPSPLVLPH